jgi:hypothetical protein
LFIELNWPKFLRIIIIVFVIKTVIIIYSWYFWSWNSISLSNMILHLQRCSKGMHLNPIIIRNHTNFNSAPRFFLLYWLMAYFFGNTLECQFLMNRCFFKDNQVILQPFLIICKLSYFDFYIFYLLFENYWSLVNFDHLYIHSKSHIFNDGLFLLPS